jgi:phage host-nuclease inhibitor protein Gam
MTISEAVEIYIKLRNKKAQMKAEFEAQTAPINEKLSQLEAKLMDTFNKTGVDSVKTEFGTAYTTTRTTASVADREVFMEHVKKHDDWGLMEVRAAKAAIEQFREANNDELPPGINVRVERVVNVRKSA